MEQGVSIKKKKRSKKHQQTGKNLRKYIHLEKDGRISNSTIRILPLDI